MADSSHLERMGRELKCPICLSLLNKAASLTCNHVFCHCCIQESMKSAPYCPVCKVPFRRREIRPAPHMDNLVNIYKSMEVDSGVNIFVTQAAPSKRTSGIENHPDDGRIFELQEKEKTCVGTSPPQKQKTNVTKGLSKCVQIPAKPSFPAKKRVHVPQCPPSKWENETAIVPNNKLEGSNLPEHEPALDREPLFTPFFWLKDDKGSQETTQQTQGDQTLGTPPDVPSFSDIKDSDDEVPNHIPSEKGRCTTDGEKDVFDSEMFEWTQRACSPELCSSPVRTQGEDGAECERQEANRFALHTETVVMESNANKRGIMINTTNPTETNLPSSPSPRYQTVNERAAKSGKRTKKAVERKQSKRAKKIPTIDASRDLKELENVVQKNMQQFGESGESGNRETGNLSSSSSGGKLFMQDNNKIVVDLPVSSNHKKYETRSNSKGIGKIRGNISPGLKSSFDSQTKSLKVTMKSMALNRSEVLLGHSPEKLSCHEVEGFDMGRTLRRCKAKPGTKKPHLKMVRFPEENSNDNQIKRKVASKEGEKSGADQKKYSKREVGSSLGIEASNRPLDGKITEKIICAFCQSAEDSEVSGVMLHYLNGKSVAGCDIGRPNVIHCHKDCAEWAPKVFFEVNQAINLEAELNRSRKIKCRLCGNRGAALGCFERGCRRSFHVPCAKMTPQFRWDYENFVVLCPLHAFGKLPCEAPTLQSNQKSSALERNSHLDKTQVGKGDRKENLPWKNKNAKDFILCCSGLTNIEKDVIAEFQKLSGITVLKNWDLSVTHVVASTDDNGACKRTLKFLMGVLEGKWIVNIEWVKACMKSTELVDEQPYEIKIDTHGIKDGPPLGRSRCLQKKPKLFNGCRFYFTGNFVPSYKGYLQDLVVAAGGYVLKRKPVAKGEEYSFSSNNSSSVFVVYSIEQPDEEEKSGRSKTSSSLKHRRVVDDAAETLASSSGGVAVTNSWLLNSIAGCKLQNFSE